MTIRDAIRILEEKGKSISGFHGLDNDFVIAIRTVLVEVKYKPEGIKYQDIVYKICQLFDTSSEKCTIDIVIDKVKLARSQMIAKIEEMCRWKRKV